MSNLQEDLQKKKIPSVDGYSIQGRSVMVNADGLDVLSIQVDGKMMDIRIKDFLNIKEEFIDEHIKENSSNYTYFSALLSWYEYIRDVLEQELEAMKASLEIKIREKYSDTKTKIVIDVVQAQINTTQVVLEAKAEILKLNYICKRLSGFVKGIEKKGDRLSQLYARKSKEREIYGG